MQCTELGGMELASLRLMEGLAARGHELAVLSLNPLGRLAPRLAAAGISARGLPYRGRGGWRSAASVRAALAASRHDALIMTGHHLLTMLGLPRRRCGRRLLALHHVHRGAKPAWQWRLIYRAARDRFDVLSFPSDALRREAEALAPAIAPLALTLRNPLPLPAPTDPRRRAAARRALGLPLGAELVGNAGRLIPDKRFDVFLDSAALIARRRASARFVIAGDGPERGPLQARAAALGLAGRLRWLGWQADLEPFYRALDVLLFNAEHEALPTTPLEAMAHGLPVVASLRRGGLDEVMTGAGCGLLLDRHDPPRLARLCCAVLGGRLPGIGQEARARIAALADPAQIAERVEALLDARP
jgi:glycosyltransferase involved in cell wall biosynthesis